MSISSAIRNRMLITFSYRGFHRTVEPHTYGIDAKGHYALRAYQVAGGSESGENGWKLFHIDEAVGVSISSQSFQGPRPGYQRADRAFRDIRAQL